MGHTARPCTSTACGTDSTHGDGGQTPAAQYQSETGNYIFRKDVLADVPTGYDPQEVPLYESQDVLESEYAAAERAGEPFFAVEAYEDGYAVTYDLLPAGKELSPPAASEVGERLTREVEDIVADERMPTTEVSRSVSASLGHVAFFGREHSARRVAADISTVVLDETNWVEASQPSDAPGSRRN